MNLRIARAVLVSIVFIGLATSLATAALIPGMSFEHYPRVYSMDVSVNYDADGGTGGNGLLTASGYTWDCYESDPDSSYPLYGFFDLSVEIDKTNPNDIVAVGGTLVVSDEPVYGDPLVNLFASTTLTDFGFGGDDLLQFLFVQNGPGMPPENEPVGIIISGVSIDNALFSEANPPTFQEDFSNTGNGSSNAFYLPEPASMILLSVGFGSLCLRRRRK